MIDRFLIKFFCCFIFILFCIVFGVSIVWFIFLFFCLCGIIVSLFFNYNLYFIGIIVTLFYISVIIILFIFLLISKFNSVVLQSENFDCDFKVLNVSFTGESIKLIIIGIFFILGCFFLTKFWICVFDVMRYFYMYYIMKTLFEWSIFWFFISNMYSWLFKYGEFFIFANFFDFEFSRLGNVLLNSDFFFYGVFFLIICYCLIVVFILTSIVEMIRKKKVK